MKNSTPNPVEGIAHNHNGARLTSFLLGEDTDGASHLYRDEDGQSQKMHKLNDTSFDSLNALETFLTAR